MKKTIFAFAVTTIMTVTVLPGCDSSAQKVEAAKENVKDAKEDLKDARQELNAEYPSFRKNAEEQIVANDQRIAQLKAKLAKPGKAPLDNMREQRIEDLEKRNADLRSRLYGYEKEHSDWEAFKSQFNADMAKLHDDLTGKDKK